VKRALASLGCIFAKVGAREIRKPDFKSGIDKLKGIIFTSSIVLFVIVALLPILYMFAGSFVDEGRFSLTSYQQVLSERRQLSLLKNSLLIATFTALLAILVGVPFAVLITRTDMPLRGIFTVLCIVPLLIPPYINAVAWIYLLGQKGVFNILFMNALNLEAPLFTIYGIWGVAFVLALSYFPMVTLLTAGALKSIDPKLEEAGRLFASEFRVLRDISLKLVKPNILSGGLFVFIFALSNFGVPALLRIHVYTIEVFSQFSAFFDAKAATATSVPLVVITLGVFLLQRLHVKTSHVTLSGDWYQLEAVKLNRWKWLALLFCSTVICLAVIFPLSVLVAKSASLDAYVMAFTTAREELKNSLLFSTFGATVLTGLGLVMAYIGKRKPDLSRASKSGIRRWRSREIINLSSVLLYAIPAPVLGVGLIRLWNRPGVFNYVYGTSVIIILAYVARFIPFSATALSSTLKHLDISLEEASASVGAGWTRTMIKIVMPLMKQGIFATWAISFVLCLGELGASVLVCPAGKTTLPVRIFTIMHYGPDKLVAALCIILINIIILPLVILGGISRLRFGSPTSAK